MAQFHPSGDLAADRRYLWAEASRAAGDLAGAADLFAQATDQAPGWAAAWFALGETQAGLGEAPAARVAFGRCLMLDPADGFGAGLRLALMDGAAAPLGMPAGYIAQLFDDYATRFDAHLTGALGYCGPALTVAALKRACAARGRVFRFGAALDLGCGTGLMAEALAGHITALDGVDLSAGMLDEARITGQYRALSHGDVVAHLADLPAGARYDLIVAADVMGYIGALAPLLAAVAARLAIDGLFAFTAQTCAGDGYELGADLRFAHGPAYLSATAAGAGLHLLALETASARRDGGRDVPGVVAVLGLPQPSDGAALGPVHQRGHQIDDAAAHLDVLDAGESLGELHPLGR